MSDIILTTLNGRYSHSSIGLRYLYANLKELQEKASIKEYVINERMQDIAEKILSYEPKIIGIGVYIWNVSDVYELLEIIKKVSPDTVVILGGPEVSYTPFRVDLSKADYIIQGEGEVQFYNLCKDILENVDIDNKIFPPQILDLESIELPYKYYNDNDVQNRYIYVEAARGCPFSCEFCLSSIDKQVRNFDIDELLNQFETLWSRGVRNYKFIDRTFNLNIDMANKLIDFFLQKDEAYTVHFEVIPDHFPQKLKDKIKQFPAGSLQLEIGIQTLKKDIAKNIKRNLNIPKIKENIAFLENETKAHIHLDLIIGLPGESIESFGENLDYLCSLSNSEVQVGVLKKLSGTTLNRHDEIFGMVYSDIPPYDILSNDLIPFEKMQKMKRFSRYWDLVYNSGNFTNSFNYLVKDGSVYEIFYDFTIWLYSQTHSTWQISLDRLAKFLFDYMVTKQNKKQQEVADILVSDILKVGGRKLPKFLRPFSEVVKSEDKLQLNSQNKRQMKRAY
ncbi:MAG: DUF4080 domain-containing protein [Campylobacterota bacterium]|nr:DUF4080 domain-containing protein [Campylobacterota bacterium]